MYTLNTFIFPFEIQPIVTKSLLVFKPQKYSQKFTSLLKVLCPPALIEILVTWYIVKGCFLFVLFSWFAFYVFVFSGFNLERWIKSIKHRALLEHPALLLVCMKNPSFWGRYCVLRYSLVVSSLTGNTSKIARAEF